MSAEARTPASVGAAAHVIVADVHDPVADESDRHHLATVLRLRPGELVTVTDGRGAWRVTSVPSDAGSWTDGRLQPDGDIEHVAPLEPPITVGFGLLKGDKCELVVQKLTELGVDRIVPVACARSVVRWDGARRERHLARLRVVAREAAMQSRRCHLPVVEDVLTVVEAVQRWPRAALAAHGGDPPRVGDGTVGADIVLVGPEGGWSPEELALVEARVGLAEHVLRAETAAVALAAVLTALRSGRVTATVGADSPATWPLGARNENT